MTSLKSHLGPYRGLALGIVLGSLVLSAVFQNGFAQQPPETGSVVDFHRDIQPILAANCVGCHQGSAGAAGLGLDSPENLMRGGSEGAVVVPGNPEQSLLVIRIEDTGDTRMPPEDNLDPTEISLIKAWINQGAESDPTIDFVTDVQPIFGASCYSCHSGNEPRAGLHLDSKPRALEGGVSGPAILPGDSRGSLLLHRVLGEDGQPQMPRTGTPLTADQVAVLATWIDQGANWPESATKMHWSYVKPLRPPVPTVQNPQWVRNPIDNFVLTRLEKEGLNPSPVTADETLVRRLYLDLTGIPPSPSQVDAFLSDTRPDAYERLVDELLASPHYGERMTTPWLDLARYADSNGYERDYQRVAWPYRDWVIQAFNENKPFNEFTIEQIAGDLLPNATIPQQTATGFVRASMLNTEGGTDGDEQVWVAHLDRAVTVGNVFLGATIQCTQCHDHKYDPFTQKQFYELVAFFDNIQQEIGEGGGPFDFRAVPERRILLPSGEQALRCEEIDFEFSRLNADLNADTLQNRVLEARWEESFIQADKAWQPAEPTRVSSQGGSTLTVSNDRSILVSGENPGSEIYIVEANSPVAGNITGIRIDALPHETLPYNGPGRDHFGNFVVNGVSIGAGPTFSEVAVELSADNGGNRRGEFEEWESNLAEAEQRVPMMLLAIPEEPIQVERGGTFSVTLSQSGADGAGLGRFRISVTTGENSKEALGLPYHLRALLTMAPEVRLNYEPGLAERMNVIGGRDIELSDSLCGQPSFITSRPPTREGEQREDLLVAYWRGVAPELESVRTQIADLRREVVDMKIPSTLVLMENMGVNHPTTFIHERGEWTLAAEEVEAGVPAFLGSPFPENAPPNRLGLAKWLVSSDNPLTSRVRVNQIWQMIFGLGIVQTAGDFGTQGFRPSHPELLDWLASEFVSNGWDQKAILRLIVTSSAYRQSSKASPELLAQDPQNVLLARGGRYRVEAEMVRDIVLSVSGLLSTKIGGPPVMPPQPGGLWSFPGGAPNDEWIESEGEDKYRRGLYVFIRRTVRYPSLVIFDAPSREITIARRDRSNTPFQALTRLNDPVYFEAARALSRRIRAEGGSDPGSRLAYGFRLATSRMPNEIETDVLIDNYEEQLQYFRSHLDEAEAVSGEPDAGSAAWIMVSNSLLNLNETITRN